MAEPRITQYQLADALKGMRLSVRVGEGDLAAGGLVNGEVHVPDNVALHVFRAVGEPHPTGPRLRDADLCARCGNQFRPGQVCDSCRESHSYQLAQALGSQAEPQPDTPADPELAAMAAILAVMDALDDHAIELGTDVHERVIRWAMARWNVRA